MDSRYLNSVPGPQPSGDGRALTAPSYGQEFFLSPSSQGSASHYLPAAVLQSYSLAGPDGHVLSTAPQIPQSNFTSSFRPPVGRFIGAPPTFDHPHQNTDRGSAHYQGRSHPPFPTIPTSVPPSGIAAPYNAAKGNRASPRSHGSGQSRSVARRFAPVPPLDTALRPPIGSDTYQNTPPSTSSHAMPAQTFSPAQRTPVPSYASADPLDIEFAQYRYGNKRCFYRCRFDVSGTPCNQWIVGERTRVLRHLRSHHHLQTGPSVPARCRWERCTHSRPMKQENLSRHVVTHLGVKWKCPHCSRLFSRDDAVHRHIERVASGMDVTEAEVMPGREARALTEFQFKRARTA